MKNAFITGNSSGLGFGLTELLLEKHWRVYGCSRRGCRGLDGDLEDLRCDLTDFAALPGRLDTLLGRAPGLDLVVLNAGALGEIKPFPEVPVGEAKRVMDVNVWANKAVLDWLAGWGRPIRQIVMISSGAAVLGNRGWGAYALSKATLNMLARLYSHEFPDTHVCALAPGLVDSAMMDYLCEVPDPAEYPALRRIREARGTDRMPGPKDAARKVISVLDDLLEQPTGSFVDIRQILEPEEYRQLMNGR